MEGRYLYNCRSLCVYLTHSHLSCATAEREASLPLQETTAALAIVALPLSSAQRREEAVKERTKSDATDAGVRHPWPWPSHTIPDCASYDLHNPKRSGTNLSQTMLRHLTVGSTIGSGDTTLSNATMQPDRQAHGEAVRTTRALHNSPSLLFHGPYTHTAVLRQWLSSHVTKPARNSVREHTPQVPPLLFAVSVSPLFFPQHSRMPFWSC